MRNRFHSFVCIVLLVILTSSAAFCQSIQENNIKIKTAVMQGPTGFSAALLNPSVFDISVYPSPNEAVSRLISGELDMAALPTNTAAAMYNKGAKIKIIAVIGEGMLSIIGTNHDSGMLFVPGAGGTPDHMATYLYPEYEKSYSISSPAQLAQMVIAGKANLAILPEPFASMVLSANKECKTISDVQKKWFEKTGDKSYPMSVLVVSDSFLEKNDYSVDEVCEMYRHSVSRVLEHPDQASVRIQELGIMNARTALNAIPLCEICFKSRDAGKNEFFAYCKTLMDIAPQAIGLRIPDDGIWVR